jgi:hypothetical protein
MELENQTTEQTNETTQPVSNENVQTEVLEWKAPSKEEYEIAIKSAANKANTEILKSLGVKSVKEFKETYTKFEQEKSNLDTLIKEKDEYAGKSKSLEAELNSLKQERVLDKYNVQSEYREDLVKLAMDKVTEDKPFENVLKELVEGKYKYVVATSSNIKMGTEKTKVEPINEVDKYLEKYKGTPYYKPNKK